MFFGKGSAMGPDIEGLMSRIGAPPGVELPAGAIAGQGLLASLFGIGPIISALMREPPPYIDEMRAKLIQARRSDLLCVTEGCGEKWKGKVVLVDVDGTGVVLFEVGVEFTDREVAIANCRECIDLICDLQYPRASTW